MLEKIVCSYNRPKNNFETLFIKSCDADCKATGKPVRLIVIKNSFSMNNIYTKTVHKEYSTPHEYYTQLHQLGG